MKYLFVILLAIPFLTKGQEAKIQFNIKNANANLIEIVNGDYTSAEVLFGKSDTEIPLVEGKGSWVHKLSKPMYAVTYYQDSVTKEYFNYFFYLSPGDNIEFFFDSNKPETTYTVKGKGSENNQPSIQNLTNNRFILDAYKTYKTDSLPNNVFEAIKEESTLNKKILTEYITAYHPTKEFVKINKLFVQYFPMWTYMQFKGNQKFNVRQPFLRNEIKWQAIEDSLTNANPVSNDEMLSITTYDYFLANYLTRIKERLWQHPELLKEYYGTNTQEEAVKIDNEDPENLLQEKIINKHFTGKTAEFLYGVLFNRAINEKEDNLPEIFARFKEKYSQSQYIQYIEPAILKIEEKRRRTLTDKMVFAENADSYQTFNDILKLVKGKTVLLDMWGTWCGPCLSELSLNSDSIKNYFKDKGLDYLYIANHDTGKKIKWKELISYYDLTGTHILATPQLTKDIMTSVKGEGFPTYIIINKDGTFKLSEAGYPMKREVLIKQLERALNE